MRAAVYGRVVGEGSFLDILKINILYWSSKAPLASLYAICTLLVQYLYVYKAYIYCTSTVQVLYNGRRGWGKGDRILELDIRRYVIGQMLKKRKILGCFGNYLYLCRNIGWQGGIVFD